LALNASKIAFLPNIYASFSSIILLNYENFLQN
jgi:hypothetical protein